MVEPRPRLAAVISTDGSVFLNTVPRYPDLSEHFVGVVSDRESAGIDGARKAGFNVRVLAADTGLDFSNLLLKWAAGERVDWLLSFYTRLFRGRLLQAYEGRILNFHPSLLPANPGVRGFEKSLASGATVIGATVHLVDEGVDTGMPIQQALVAVKPEADPTMLRQAIFEAQSRQLIQACDWILEGRLQIVDERPKILGADYEIGPFVPTLDSHRASGWRQGDSTAPSP